MVKYLIITSSILLLSCSIRVPRSIRDKFDCYEPQNVRIDSLLNINGFYAFSFKDSTYAWGSMFFADGGFIDRLQYSLQGDSIMGYYLSGTYKIYKDTIITQAINYPSLMAPWDAWETWYKIINKNEIVVIKSFPIHPMTESDWNNFYVDESRRERSNGIFTPMNHLPLFDCWIKQEKWFWCNEEDWKEYKKQIN
jgi:hypothetical protein